MTDALKTQKVASLKPVEEVVQAMLAQGEPPCDYIHKELERDEVVDKVFVPTRLLGEQGEARRSQ